jgi:hypothetical protein
MLLHLFPQPLVVSPPGRKILEPRQKPSQESHVQSSAFTAKNRAVICRTAALSALESLFGFPTGIIVPHFLLENNR